MEQLYRLLLSVTLLIVITGGIGCELIDEDDEEETTDIEGLWHRQGDDEGDLYVLIDSETITVYEYSPDRECYYTMVLDIMSVDGDDYTLGSDGEAPEHVTIVRNGDRLNVTLEDEGKTITEIFAMSSADTGSFAPSCSDDITGVWDLDDPDGDMLSIHIEEDYITVYEFRENYPEMEDCYSVTQYAITEVNGNQYTLENTANEQDVIQVTIESGLDELYVERPEGDTQINERYFYSDRSVGSFTPQCPDVQME